MLSSLSSSQVDAGTVAAALSAFDFGLVLDKLIIDANLPETSRMKAARWCSQALCIQLQDLSARLDDFCEALELKPLEARRFQNLLEVACQQREVATANGSHDNTMSLKIKNTFIEAKEDALDANVAWRRHVTMPEWGDSKESSCGTGRGLLSPILSLEALPGYSDDEEQPQEQPAREPPRNMSVMSNLSNMSNKDITALNAEIGFQRRLSELDADWRRCTTACSWDEPPSTGFDLGYGSAFQPRHVDFAADGMAEEEEQGSDDDDALDEDADGQPNGFMMMPPFIPSFNRLPMTTMPVQPTKKAADNTNNTASATWQDTVTTVMLKNLQNRLNQRDLIVDMQENGFAGTFDFLYLPLDVDTNANRGYAFINFTGPEHAKSFKQHYESGRDGSKKMAKPGKGLRVSPATLQGFAANYAHYSNARVQRGPPEHRPLFLRTLNEDDPQEAHSTVKAKNRRRNRSLIDMAAQETANKAATQANPLRKFCHQCGGKVKSQFKFCIYCGKTVFPLVQ